jgi:hypothetical protein
MGILIFNKNAMAAILEGNIFDGFLEFCCWDLTPLHTR